MLNSSRWLLLKGGKSALISLTTLSVCTHFGENVKETKNYTLSTSKRDREKKQGVEIKLEKKSWVFTE